MLFSQTGAASGAHMNQLTSPTKPLNSLQGAGQQAKVAANQNHSSQMVV